MSDLSASLVEANDIEVTSESISQISDDILFKKLKVLNLNPGPITPSTRKLYEKKLLNHLQLNNSNDLNGYSEKPSKLEANIESLRYVGSFYDSKDNQNMNDSFDSYSRQISSIRSRAPMHSDKLSAQSSEHFF